MAYKYSSTLKLSHADISSDTTAQTAVNAITGSSWSGWKAITTWRINLKDVMGSTFYDENFGKTMVLRLNQLGYTQYVLGTNPVFSQDAIYYLSGLTFKSSTYDASKGMSTDQYPMCCMTLYGGTQATVQFAPNVSLAMFVLDRQYVDLTITMRRTSDNRTSDYNCTSALPHHCFMFDIYALS